MDRIIKIEAGKNYKIKLKDGRIVNVFLIGGDPLSFSIDGKNIKGYEWLNDAEIIEVNEKDGDEMNIISQKGGKV